MPHDDGSPVFDDSVLREVAESAGMAPAELLELFITDAEANLAVIAEASARGDAVALNRTAHSMKSSAASVGAVRVAQSARMLEAATKSGLDDAGLAACATLAEELATFIAIAAARGSGFAQ